ncbi:ketopantoate reductase family protein [Thalassotalea euphylliae]|uniref:2-dehydropantoate 2-reductase n=1 Tax=Thalassotalea euphylliae TaxID=1655234 RepID=A0A3E0U4Z8_9GAMM|nr:2-dehydropantoate 2-reductase [Thalassotalea euphylliae]REL32071.1 2-dehydropantoate 2-reductase [Thalassotalea euphylliae]
MSKAPEMKAAALTTDKCKHLNIVVAGQGAIGSLWCWYLTQYSAVNLSTVTRAPAFPTSPTISSFPNTPSAPKLKKQLSFSHFNGQSYQYHCLLADDKTLNNADLLVVCLKSYDAAQLVNNIASKLAPTTDILLVHNGMGVYEALSDKIKATHNIYTCLTTHGAFRPTKSHVIHTGLGSFDIGRHAFVQNEPAPWFNALKCALPNAHWQSDIKTKQWQKLAINCVINPLTALNNVCNGEITQAQYLPQISAIAKEVSEVASSQDITLEANTIVEQALAVAQATANNVSSTLADVRADRTTEINAINGYICQLAIEAGISVPSNSALVEQVNALLKSAAPSQ